MSAVCLASYRKECCLAIAIAVRPKAQLQPISKSCVYKFQAQYVLLLWFLGLRPPKTREVLPSVGSVQSSYAFIAAGSYSMISSTDPCRFHATYVAED